jgi:hypothetical protein
MVLITYFTNNMAPSLKEAVHIKDLNKVATNYNNLAKNLCKELAVITHH